MSRPEKLSRFLDLVTLRLRHSWTSSRQRRLERRMARERRLLDRALQMVADSQGRLVLLEQQAHPLLTLPSQEAPSPRAPEPPPFNPSPGLSLVQQEMQPLVEKELERLTEADRILGLAPSPRSSPSSES